MSNKPLSDEYYLEQIKLGNESALGSLYKNNFSKVAQFVYSNSGTEQEAKDIYQEAIIAFYEKLQSGNLKLTCQISTYLYSICRRLWLKKLSAKAMYTGKVNEMENFIQVEQEAYEIEQQEQRFQAMHRALSEIREPCKTLLEDYYIRKMSMEAIADKFGYTNADNAKNQKYKCLQRLKKLFFTDYKSKV